MEKVEIAKRYAKAFYDLALNYRKKDSADQKGTESGLNELEFILSLIKKEESISRFLFSPIIRKEKKAIFLKNAFSSVLKNQVSDILKNFILFLNHKKRLNILELIVKAFKELKEKKEAILNVNLYSSEGILLGKEEKWQEILAQKTKKSLKIKVKKNSSLIAGLRVEVNGLVVEENLAQQLKKMEAFLRA